MELIVYKIWLDAPTMMISDMGHTCRIGMYTAQLHSVDHPYHPHHLRCWELGNWGRSTPAVTINRQNPPQPSLATNMNESIYQNMIVDIAGDRIWSCTFPQLGNWRRRGSICPKFTSDYENPRVVRGVRPLAGLGEGEVAVQTSAADLWDDVSIICTVSQLWMHSGWRNVTHLFQAFIMEIHSITFWLLLSALHLLFTWQVSVLHNNQYAQGFTTSGGKFDFHTADMSGVLGQYQKVMDNIHILNVLTMTMLALIRLFTTMLP